MCRKAACVQRVTDRLIGEVKESAGDEPQADSMACVGIKVEA